MSHPDRIIRLALMWIRKDGFDYGVYLASDPSPVSFVFRASYDHIGRISSFLVGELDVKRGVGWEEDHILNSPPLPPIMNSEAELLSQISDEICRKWLQSSGKDEWSAIMQSMGKQDAVYEDAGLDDYLLSGLPFQMKPVVANAFFSVACPAENECFFAVFSDSTTPINKIEEKMYSFADLL